MLNLAAIIGPSFDVELLQRAAHEHIGVVEIAIELMLERWLLRQYARRWSSDPRERDLVLWAQGARRGSFEFAHPRIHRAVYRSLPDERRRVLHRQVADILSARHGPDGGAHPERIAFHYLEGSAGEAALPFLAAAAERALAMRGPAHRGAARGARADPPRAAGDPGGRQPGGALDGAAAARRRGRRGHPALSAGTSGDR